MATVGKKFTVPEKWDEPWFVNLTADQKLLIFYFWDRCDHAGAINIVPNVFSAYIGIVVTREDLIELQESSNTDKERILIIGDYIWFTEYIRINQQPDYSKPLSPKKPFTVSVVRSIKEHSGLYEEIKRRDPVLLSSWEEENGTNDSDSMELPTHNNGIPIAASKSTSNSKSISSKEEGLLSSIKEIMPGISLTNISEIAMRGDLKMAVESLSNQDIKNPEEYIEEAAKNFDWYEKDWADFLGDLTGLDMNDVPF